NGDKPGRQSATPGATPPLYFWQVKRMKNLAVAAATLVSVAAGAQTAKPALNARRPDAEDVKQFVDALETRMDALAAANPNPGWRPFQRLNRAEYHRA